MSERICKHCGQTYSYCRGCYLSPIIYKMQGFCSEACEKASKIEEVIPVEDVEVVINEEDISTLE